MIYHYKGHDYTVIVHSEIKDHVFLTAYRPFSLGSIEILRVSKKNDYEFAATCVLTTYDVAAIMCLTDVSFSARVQEDMQYINKEKG